MEWVAGRLGQRRGELPRRIEPPPNALTRWAFRELEDMQQRLSSVLGRRPQRRDGDKESITLAEWSPLVDITEDDKEYLIKAELPEIKKEEIEVTVENGVLVISGERKLEKEEKGRKYHRVERAYGSFSLSDDAAADKVNAEFNDGMLKVHIAKSESARPKQIEVEAATGNACRLPGRGVGQVYPWFHSGQCLNVLGKEDQNGKELLRNSRCEFECNRGGG
jgi:HSP20 family protein